MSSSINGGPRLVITPDDHRAFVVIVVITCTIWSVFVVGARAIWRLHQKSDFGLDDSVALLGTAVGVAQAGVILAGVRAGFGFRENVLRSSQMESAGKYLYAAALLYILSMCASRASMSLLIARLTRDRSQIKFTRILLAITLAWGVGSVFAVAFECGLPVPWVIEARASCSGLFTTWAVVESLGLLVELLILAMAASLVMNLNMQLKFKVAVVGSFTLRILLVIPVAFRLNLLRKIPTSSGDSFFQTIDMTIVTIIILHYSLWAASFPCMRAFLRAFDTGMGVTTHVPTYKGSNYNNDTKGSSFAMRSLNTREIHNSQSKEILRRASEPSSPASTKPPTTAESLANADTIEKIGGLGAGNTTTLSRPAGAEAGGKRKVSDETASQNSRKAIITRTVEWTVEVQDADGDTVMPGRAL